jgi:hypothetical protein
MTVPLLQHESIPPGQETFAFSSAEAQTIDQQDHGPEEQPHAIAA